MSLYADIIIPTYENPDYLIPCVHSIIKTGVLDWMGRLIIVNNGQLDLASQFSTIKNILVLDAKDAEGRSANLGWEGGLALGLQVSNAPFVVFQNDDTFIPASDYLIYHKLLQHFRDPDVGAVGPATTTAMGRQTIYDISVPRIPTESKFLIFFCVMLRRSLLDEVGGVDTSLPGGDDLDLSIRIRKAGKKLIFEPRAFLIHHGFKTGERVEGSPLLTGGWNSLEKIEKTNWGLICKHGIREFKELWTPFPEGTGPVPDSEADCVRQFVTGDAVLELACGGRKTVDISIGVDRVPYGDQIPNVDQKSVADVVWDIEDPLPMADFSQDTIIARHALEHCIDVVGALRNWNRVLKIGGRLIIAVPDEDRIKSIPTNPEHKHAFNQESLNRLLGTCGFELVKSEDPNNWISFVSCFEKVAHCVDEKQPVPIEVAVQ